MHLTRRLISQNFTAGTMSMPETTEMVDVSLDRRGIPDAFKAASRRLVIIDYDGVLVPLQKQTGLTIPTRETKLAVQQLASEPKNRVIVMTNRDRQHLDLHWASLNGVIVAEFGAMFRETGRPWRSLFDIDNSWMDSIGDALAALQFHYSGSYLERRVHSMTWHYMNLPGRLVDDDIQKIVAAIRALPHSGEFEIYQGQHSLEFGARGVDPGSFIARWIGGQKFDMVIALGGDRMNGTLFEILTNDAATVSVNPAMTSRAKYWLRQQTDVLPFLKSLVASGQ